MDKKTHLLFIPYTLTNGGGAEKILQLLVNSLPAEKYEVDIEEIEQFNKFLMLKDNVKLLQPFLSQKLPFKLFNELNYIMLLYWPSVIKNLYRLNSYDTVITFNYQLPSFLLPAFNHENKIAWFHGDLYDLEDREKKWEREKQKKVWEKADKIISISNKSFQSLKDIFPDFVNKAAIIHNGIDIKNILETGREKCDLPFKDIPYFCCIGRIDENKNFILAIRAVTELNKKGINCALVIAGEGNQKALLQKEAENLSISDKIYFAGFQTNPYKFINSSKALCLTSFSEGWPTVVMEAMALGKPFVTTPVSGASEELSDGGKCGLVSGYEVSEYASALQSLLQDEKLYKQMCSNCQNHVQEYSVENFQANFIRVLNTLKKQNYKSTKAKETILSIFSFFIYFFLLLFSAGEIIYRIQIIKKRIREKRIIKVFKNFIYLFGIIILLPFTCIIKTLCFPFFIRKIFIKSGKKCR